MKCILYMTIKVKSTSLNSGLRESLYTLNKEQKVICIFWQYLEYKPGLTHQAFRTAKDPTTVKFH